jgi:hypothetical protein
MARYADDSIFFSLNGKEDVRLDHVKRDEQLDIDMIITAVVVTNTEDETSDMEYGYFRANQLQADGTWKQMRGDDFTYSFQRAMQPLIEKAGHNASGPMPCMMHSEFHYAHIPLHQARRMRQELASAIKNTSKAAI